MFIILLVGSCHEPPVTTTSENKIDKEDDIYYHYSIWWAFVNKIYDGTLTAKELKTKGDIGLGSYNALGGELVMLDGTLYKVTEDGVVSEARDEELISFANATFFNPEQSFNIDSVVHHAGLRNAINDQLKTKNIFYAFCIHGEFGAIKLGGVPKQEKPYETGLDVLIPARPVFEGENVSGTIVGFSVRSLLEILMYPTITFTLFRMIKNLVDMLWNLQVKT